MRDQDVSEALTDAGDRRILAACIRRPKAVKEISHEAALPLPTAYRHVNRLMETGMLVVERSAMTPDGKRYDLYRSRIRSAAIEIDATGERITWQPNEPIEERLSNLWGSLREQAMGRRGGQRR